MLACIVVYKPCISTRMDKKVICISGGGVRCNFALGCIMKLKSINPPLLANPHVVSGVSAGSLVAASLATNSNLDELYSHISHATLTPRIGPCGIASQAMHLYTGSNAFLYSNLHLKEFIDSSLQNRPIFHTLNVYAAKTSTLKQHLFQCKAGTTPNTSALLASCSIPGVFPAVQIENESFIDGGAESNFPLRDIQQAMHTPEVSQLHVFSTHPWDMRSCDALRKSRQGKAMSTKSLLGTLAVDYMHAAAFVDDLHTLNMLQLQTPLDGPFVALYSRQNGNPQLVDIVTDTSEPTHVRQFDLAAMCYAPTVKQYIESKSETINLTTPWRRRTTVTNDMLEAGKKGAVQLNQAAIKAGATVSPKLIM